MSENNQTEHGLAANTQGRRKFMRRVGTGAVIAALPMKSVWANGITNSIIASGHGSDWAGGATLNLLNWPEFKSMYTDPDTAPKFSTVFDGKARHKNDTKFLGNRVSFYNILHEKKMTELLRADIKAPIVIISV